MKLLWSPVSASRDCGSVPAVSVSEAGVTSPVSERGAGHQGPAEAGIVPLSLVAAPVPALSDNSDCVLAESAEAGRVPLAEEAAVEPEAAVTSPVPEWGAGHQGPAEAGTVPLGLVAAPIPALSDIDCVLTESAEEEAAIQFEAGVTSPVLERGAGHQGPAEAGIVPLGLVAAPAPVLSDNNDCVLAESAEAGTVPVMEEAVMESEAGVTSPVLERGAGHQGPAEAGTVPLGLVAAPAPALSGDSDCVLAVSPQPSTSSQPEQSPVNPVIQC